MLEHRDTRRIGGLESKDGKQQSASADTRRIGGLETCHG